MDTVVLTAISLASAASLIIVWRRWRLSLRGDYVRSYRFPPGLYEKLREKRPGLDAKQFQLIARGLRQFFLAHLRSGCRFVAMPSQAVDDLWHEFILYTRHYDSFCKQAFGRFMHHTPAVVLGKSNSDNVGLRRIWWYACLEENINPRMATRLPLLFALDAKLGIGDGFQYELNCKRRDSRTGGCNGSTHCGGDFSDASFDGSTEGFGDAWSDGGAGDSGCGGGGCGGD